MNIQYLIEKLLDYSITNALMDPRDYIYVRNLLCDALKVAMPTEDYHRNEDLPDMPVGILDEIMDYAAQKGLLQEDTQAQRELFDTRLMGLIAPAPSVIIDRFYSIYKDDGAKAALDWFYAFCGKINYIRTAAVAKNIYFTGESPYGTLEITINMSKPEFTPQEIIQMRNSSASNYPKCMLCHDNEGFAGRVGRPARQTLRCIPVTLNDEPWYLQYSPYVYYNEHCIAYAESHTPMKIDQNTAVRLFDFIDLFPHYFIGSNSDLPIVGGSILSHNHFQGGNHRFSMQDAPVLFDMGLSEAGSKVDLIKWPLSTIKLSGKDRNAITADAGKIMAAWRGYTNETLGLFAQTDGEPHNTVTTIASKQNGVYELFVVLRNNITTPEHALGVYHPHQELHHIKLEGIGLIEVMGLFVLPARLNKELSLIEAILTGAHYDRAQIDAENCLYKHLDWIDMLTAKYGTGNSSQKAKAIIQKEVCVKCTHVLETCGVFKLNGSGTAEFKRFIKSCLNLKVLI